VRTWRVSGRDGMAVLAGLAAPLALAAVLVPFRASFPNTDAALAAVPGSSPWAGAAGRAGRPPRRRG
jgi:hypothetical protein